MDIWKGQNHWIRVVYVSASRSAKTFIDRIFHFSWAFTADFVNSPTLHSALSDSPSLDTFFNALHSLSIAFFRNKFLNFSRSTERHTLATPKWTRQKCWTTPHATFNAAKFFSCVYLPSFRLVSIVVDKISSNSPRHSSSSCRRTSRGSPWSLKLCCSRTFSLPSQFFCVLFNQLYLFPISSQRRYPIQSLMQTVSALNQR